MHRKLILCLAYVLIFVANVEAGQRLTAETLWRLDRLAAPVAHPDGQSVALPVTEYDESKVGGSSVLYKLAIAGPSKEMERLRLGHTPVFSPDGSKLACVYKRALFVMSAKDPCDEGTELVSLPTGIIAPCWVGEWIYFISHVWPGKTWEEMEELCAEPVDEQPSAKVWDALPYASWNHFVDQERQFHLYRVPADGGEIQALTDGSGVQLGRRGAGADDYSVSPDGKLLAFVADCPREGIYSSPQVFIKNLASGQLRRVSLDPGFTDASPLFSPDSRLLAFTRQHIPGFYADLGKLMIHNVETASTEMLHATWDRSASGLVWASDSEGLYGAIDDAGTRRIYYLPLQGDEPLAITQSTDYDSLSVLSDGTLIARNQSYLYPPRIVHIDPASKTTQRIDSFNDELLAELDLGSYESVTYTGANGDEIQMWVNYPPGFDRSKRYPLFLLIHGGPHNALTDSFHFRWNAQCFSSWGYVTAWPNFHGSSGFGQEFCDSINPDWVTLPYEDVIAAAEWLAEQTWIDAGRMVAGGGSYGGYLSSILLGREHPFQSLVIHAAVYDLYAQTAADWTVHQERFGPYWENTELYPSISPHYFAKDFETPSLVLHGQQDLRVPVGQAFELFRALQIKGVESRLVYYPDECHWVQKRANSIHWYAEVENWIARFAAPETDGQVESD